MQEIIDRIDQLIKECPDARATQAMLLEEIRAHFARYEQVPEHTELALQNHYSHNILKKTFACIGYRTGAKPNCDKLLIRRIK